MHTGMNMCTHACTNTHTHTRRNTHLRVISNLKVVITKVTFHPELKYWCRIVLAHLCLFSIITNTCMAVTRYHMTWVYIAHHSPTPIWFPHPAHQMLNGSSNLQSTKYFSFTNTFVLLYTRVKTHNHMHTGVNPKNLTWIEGLCTVFQLNSQT